MLKFSSIMAALVLSMVGLDAVAAQRMEAIMAETARPANATQQMPANMTRVEEMPSNTTAVEERPSNMTRPAVKPMEPSATRPGNMANSTNPACGRGRQPVCTGDDLINGAYECTFGYEGEGGVCVPYKVRGPGVPSNATIAAAARPAATRPAASTMSSNTTGSRPVGGLPRPGGPTEGNMANSTNPDCGRGGQPVCKGDDLINGYYECTFGYIGADGVCAPFVPRCGLERMPVCSGDEMNGREFECDFGWIGKDGICIPYKEYADMKNGTAAATRPAVMPERPAVTPNATAVAPNATAVAPNATATAPNATMPVRPIMPVNPEAAAAETAAMPREEAVQPGAAAKPEEMMGGEYKKEYPGSRKLLMV